MILSGRIAYNDGYFLKVSLDKTPFFLIDYEKTSKMFRLTSKSLETLLK